MLLAAHSSSLAAVMLVYCDSSQYIECMIRASKIIKAAEPGGRCTSAQPHLQLPSTNELVVQPVRATCMNAAPADIKEKHPDPKKTTQQRST
jgi:hypothetical protein